MATLHRLRHVFLALALICAASQFLEQIERDLLHYPHWLHYILWRAHYPTMVGYLLFLTLAIGTDSRSDPGRPGATR